MRSILFGKYVSERRAFSPRNATYPKSIVIMRILIDLPTRRKSQEMANRCAQELMEKLTRRDLNLDVVVTFFDSSGTASQLLRNQFFKRYNRLEIDVETNDHVFDDGEDFSSLLRSAVYHGLTTVGHQDILVSIESMDVPWLRVASRFEKSHGIIALSVFRKDGGCSPQEALSVLTEWFKKIRSKSVSIDGEIEVGTDGLHVYFSSNSKNFPTKLCAFAEMQFGNNSVLILNADETIACEW